MILSRIETYNRLPLQAAIALALSLACTPVCAQTPGSTAGGTAGSSSSGIGSAGSPGAIGGVSAAGAGVSSPAGDAAGPTGSASSPSGNGVGLGSPGSTTAGGPNGGVSSSNGNGVGLNPTAPQGTAPVSSSSPSTPSATSQATQPGNAITLNPSTPIVLDLPTTIRMTLDASSALAIANRNLDRDRAQIDEAESLGRPRVNGSATETYLNRPIKITFGTQTIVAEPESTQDVQVKATIPIDLSGQISNGLSLVKLQLLADQFLRDQIVNSLVLKADTYYLNELRASHQVSVAQAALEDAQTQQDIATRQFNAGIGLKIDMLRAETQVAQAQNSLLQATNMFALAQTNLNDAVGRPLGSAVAAIDVPGVTTGVAMPPQVAVAGTSPAVTVPPISTPAFFTPPLDELTAIDVNKSIAAALATRPELLADQVQIEAAKRQIKLAHRGIEPSLNLSTSGDYYPTTSFQEPYDNVEAIVATLTVPLYDGGQTRDQVREAKDTAENLKTSYDSNKTDVELQVRQAYLNLQTAGQQIDAANTALKQAVAARELAQVRYGNGVGLYLEVTDAEAALTSAEIGQVNAVYDFMVARSQFENAVGAPRMNPSL